MKIILFILAYLALSFTASAHGISDADKAGILAGGNLEYIKLGASHMLTGYDHLLFLFGVMFFLTRFRDVVKFITAFTLGHCITLIFATLFQIKANFYLIDAVIALTVCYKAFDNLDGFKKLVGVESPNLLIAVFVFGLIHGFGLSTRLQELPLGKDGLLMRILSFNVGVELGQILALSIMLLLLSQWRKFPSFTHFAKITNILLMFAGVILFLMQIHGYEHSSSAHSFPLNTDEHYEIHQALDTERDVATEEAVKQPAEESSPTLSQ